MVLPEASMGSPWCIHGIPMVLSWTSIVLLPLEHGFSAALPWCFHGEPVVLTRGFHGAFMVLSWYFHEGMVFPWCFHGEVNDPSMN